MSKIILDKRYVDIPLFWHDLHFCFSWHYGPRDRGCTCPWSLSLWLRKGPPG